jgi:dTDP-glucose 4,6-dehydratase
VYGSLGPNDAPWTEASPYAPKNPYSASKAASDHLALAFHNTYGLPVIVTHSANNYGSRQHPEKLIPTLIRQCMNGEPMTLHGDGKQKRDWLHVDDHCRGLLSALEHGKVGETYNFGGECERTNYQIAAQVSHYVTNGGLGQITYIEDRPGNDRRYAMEIGKATNELGWEPVYTIESSIAEVVQWYLMHENYGDDYGR